MTEREWTVEDPYGLPDDGRSHEIQQSLLLAEPPGDVHAKEADCLAEGTRLVWIVDPERRRVTVYPPLLTPCVIGPANTLDDDDMVPGFAVAVEDPFRV